MGPHIYTIHPMLPKLVFIFQFWLVGKFFSPGLRIGQEILNQNMPHAYLSNFMKDVLKLLLKSVLMTYCLFLRFFHELHQGKRLQNLKAVLLLIISNISACYREIYQDKKKNATAPVSSATFCKRLTIQVISSNIF